MTTATIETAGPATPKARGKHTRGLLMLFCATLGTFNGALWGYMLTRGHDEVVAAQQNIAATAFAAQQNIAATAFHDRMNALIAAHERAINAELAAVERN